MNCEFAMREELYNTDFCFSRSSLYDHENKYDFTQKFYAFDCNVGSFCCYANRENIYKIINVAKKYNLEDLFLYKSFDKNKLYEFKNNSVDELKKKYDLSDNFPLIFWFSRRPLFITDVYLKAYLEL